MALKRFNEIDTELAKLGRIPQEDEIVELISRYSAGGLDADDIDAKLAILARGIQSEEVGQF